LKTGKRLTEADIFTGNYEEELSKILLKKLESFEIFIPFEKLHFSKIKN